MALATLPSDAINEILDNLGEPFSNLPRERRLELCSDINAAWRFYREVQCVRSTKAPHKQIRRWKEIKNTTDKLRRELRGLEDDMAYEVDKIAGHPRSHTPLSRHEIKQEIPGVSEKVTDLFFEKGMRWPSRFAKGKVAEIEHALNFLNAIADSSIAFEERLKDSTRRHDQWRDLFIFRVSLAYRRIFEREPSMYRDGPWCSFLSKVLSILERREISADVAYDTWHALGKQLAIT
jgi:hypothetical protein